MGRRRGDATAGTRGALVSIASSVLAVLAPLLLLTAVDASSAVSLAVVTLVLATLVRFDGRGAVRTTRRAVAGHPPRGNPPPVLTGRATDPVHHPRRPRAPGPA